MNQRTRATVAAAGIVAIFLLVQVGALALVGPFDQAGYQAVDDPQDPTNSLLYLVIILLATGAMLAVIRFGVDWLLRAMLVGAGAYIGLFVFRVLLPPVATVPLAGIQLNLPAWIAALALGVLLWVHPEWYVIDAAGVVMGGGAAALFGISFGVLPALLLLVILAIYDAISVYGTEHMLTLASGVMDLKVPIVLVVPLSLSYSYLDADMPDPVEDAEHAGEVADTVDEDDDAVETGDTAKAEGIAEAAADTDAEATETATDVGDSAPTEDEGEAFDRDALFIGLGDAVIPTILVASAAFFSTEAIATVDVLGRSTPLPAVTAMVGTIAGLVVLLHMVLNGRAHAGLPLLNGGAIAGYLVGALVGGLTLVQALGIEPYV
jgi:presenilin-like A22 family membrane protease